MLKTNDDDCGLILCVPKQQRRSRLAVRTAAGKAADADSSSVSRRTSAQDERRRGKEREREGEQDNKVKRNRHKTASLGPVFSRSLPPRRAGDELHREKAKHSARRASSRGKEKRRGGKRVAAARGPVARLKSARVPLPLSPLWTAEQQRPAAARSRPGGEHTGLTAKRVAGSSAGQVAR